MCIAKAMQTLKKALNALRPAQEASTTLAQGPNSRLFCLYWQTPSLDQKQKLFITLISHRANIKGGQRNISALTGAKGAPSVPRCQSFMDQVQGCCPSLAAKLLRKSDNRTQRISNVHRFITLHWLIFIGSVHCRAVPFPIFSNVQSNSQYAIILTCVLLFSRPPV